MKLRLPSLSLPPLAAAALILTGCGGGAFDQERTLPPGESTLFPELLSYCGARTPTSAEAASNGWSLEWPMHTGATNYDTSALVSAGGSSDTGLGTLDLKVALRDYRGVEGAVVGTGSIDAAVKMGVQISPALGRNSVACVSQVARLNAAAPAWLPDGTPAASMLQLAWSSYWNPALPVSQAAGYHIDGFEFVSNFTPANGNVVFTIAKSRFPATQGLSLCHLAPRATLWECAAPGVSDAGNYWQLSQSGLKQGVYLLNSSALR